MLDDAPGPVRQWASSERLHDDGDNKVPPTTPRYDSNNNDDHHSVVSSYGSPVAERGHRAVGANVNASYSKVVQGQHEIMRANIHVTHLWLQSLLLEQVDVVVQEGVIGSSSAAAAAEEVSASLKANWAEREDICRQMLHLLHSIPYVYLEPNGLYLVSLFVIILPKFEPYESQSLLTDQLFSPYSGIQSTRRGRDAAQLPLRSPHAPRPPRSRVHARLHARPVPPRPQRDR